MSEHYVMDACALLAFLNAEQGGDNVEALLRKANTPECTLYMHKLNVLEIYYGVFRDVSPEKAEETLNTIHSLPITIVDVLSDAVFKEAGRLKATYKISLADAIALAEAKTRDVQLLTSDHHEFDSIDAQKDVKFYWIR
ncbi:toxin-antitoxin system, toxin component, PIN family [Candidatus Vecturithrix granuli]|uniref:Toxin-antitoxin system, toxin component, PIN family n=1 Tax=Vecturithrix granuli TaxID=1499967 RepID=A0A081BVK3_VECG1|nr:toxin-antitoxin system, toxin component, PIN family [Candidatus Vecturithrix granuli]